MESEVYDRREELSNINALSFRDLKANNNIGRLALSKNICRFELPIDMKLFETMTPANYLERYCKVNDRRKTLYKRVFDKYKIKNEKEDFVDLKTFEECLIEVHMKSINKSHVNQIINLVGLTQQQTINFQLFLGLAALSERVLYHQFVTEDTIDLPEYQKDKIECADFGSLASKLDGINIKSPMLNLLKLL
ncbi:unnamed protein product [Brachionus calyciflorus]|uniref:Uncharacterized protein n=1 Tax=Brachionus calyciflorus TaxID=104777 RepID=A0A813MQR6_9BILA|nr:unnamed protein product [Brachionus calyciflorus]